MSPVRSAGTRYQYVPEDHYGIRANVRVSLVEQLAEQDFLAKTKGLLEEQSLKHILSVWVGSANLFRGAEGQENTNTREEADNIDEAFAPALAHLGGPTTSWDAGVWAHGFGDVFETEFQLDLRGERIALEILALPVELSWRLGEELLDRMERLNSFLDDKNAVETENQKANASFGEYLERLRSSLTSTYGASEVVYDFRVDLGSVVW